MTSPEHRPPLPLPLRTARLLLRTAEPGDLDALHSYWGDPEVTRYLPFDTLDREAALERLGRFFGVDPPAGRRASRCSWSWSTRAGWSAT